MSTIIGFCFAMSVAVGWVFRRQVYKVVSGILPGRSKTPPPNGTIGTPTEPKTPGSTIRG